nr:uncharacterized protein LOC112287553 isoform X3 [Physcomitrium patens]XP_024386398.1 uncharacterized protein LOC112287553 isoform X3 [Physcomitrium patens]|eukprot:XP_024386396.1 uncharacterized protein LOC112287553 isoform X3 [Physcomitrella patens]
MRTSGSDVVYYISCCNKCQPAGTSTLLCAGKLVRIIYSGYIMEPPLPPWECAHVWGPPLVETLKDPNMHDSFRSAAFDLIQTILAADTSALAAFSRKSESSAHPWSHLWERCRDESDHELRAGSESSRDQDYWKILKKVSDTVFEGLEKWSCVPLLWVEVLGGVLAYPTSFYKSVLWAYGRIAIFDIPGSMKVLHLDVDSRVLRWEMPKGYDDQSDNDACENVVSVQKNSMQLISTFKRYADGFLGRLGTVLHHLTLEPWFAEPLLLLLMSSNPVWKEVAQKVLVQSGASSSLESGLKLLCSSETSISAVCNAVRHASKTLMNWPLENCERALSQLFFLGLKLLNVNQGSMETVGSSSSSSVLPKLWKILSATLWPLLGRTIMESKDLISGNHELMLTRMLQLLPFVCKHIPMAFRNALFGNLHPSRNSMNWFHEFLALGGLASRAVLRWWQNAACAIVDNLVQSGSLSSSLKDIISDFLKPECPLDEDQQRQLKSLIESSSASHSFARSGHDSPAFHKTSDLEGSTGIGPQMTAAVIDLDSEDEDADEDRQRQLRVVEVIDPKGLNSDVIDLERLDHVTSAMCGVSVKAHKDHDGKDRIDKEEEVEVEEEMEDEEEVEAEDPADNVPLASLFLKPQSVQTSRIVISQTRKSGGNRLGTLDKYVHRSLKLPTTCPVKKKRSVFQTKLRAAPLAPNYQIPPLISKQPTGNKEQVSAGKQPVVAESVHKNKPQVLADDTLSKPVGHALRDGAVLRELVMDDDDELTKALNARKLSMRDGMGKEKRKIMTLQMPGEQIRPSPLARPVPVRAPPPKMDMWYRQILCMDYFSTVGLECLWVEDRCETAPLTKIPSTFPSVEKYKEIFQPFLLEEFKAQLHNEYRELSLSDGKTCSVLRLMSLERVDEFQIGRFLADVGEDAARTWTESDLLLLTRYRLQINEPQSCHILAKVDRKPEREFRGTTTTIVLKLCMPLGNSRLQNAKKYLVVRSKWHLTRVMNLSTQLREFQALSAIGNLPLSRLVLCPSTSEKTNLLKNGTAGLKDLTAELGDRIKADYNESQVSAIAAAVGRQDIAAADHQLALVQGPPGTGKTRTIVGIVSALLAWEPQSSKTSDKNNQRVSTNARGGGAVRPSVSSSVALARAWQHAALALEISGGKENLSGKDKEATMNRGGCGKRRILVCAQSNAAVDELVARLCKDGIYGKHGDFFRPLLVRVGNVNSIHPASMDIFIDTLVGKRLAAEKNATSIDDNRQQKTVMLRRKLEEVIESIQVLEASHAKRCGGDTVSKDTPSGHSISPSGQDAKEFLATSAENENLDAETSKRVERVVQEGESAVQGKLNTLYSKRRQLSSELASAEKEEKLLRKEEWAKRQEMRRAVIREADVVLTTLSGSGADVYSACMETFVPVKKFGGRKDVPEDDFFSAVVIDEAGQALEPATLIPLQLLKQTHARCVLVGDPKQLPATVISQAAVKMGYATSMFERLQRAGYPVTMLSTQYRMHPEIRRFPSAHFYDNQLTDGLVEGSRKAPFHSEWCFAPYVFFDVVDGFSRTTNSNSLINDAEADAALNIYRFLLQRYPKETNSRSFSVITPYKQQLNVIQQRFIRSLGSAKALNIEFNTVDGYQGREVDILIFSTVRASDKPGIGFVADIRRMNVALTRARFSLWIVGNASALQQNSDWAALLSDAKMRQSYFPIKYPYSFQDGVNSKPLRPVSPPPGSPMHNLTSSEASTGITVSSELSHVVQNSTARAEHGKVKSNRGEVIDSLKPDIQPGRIEHTPLENESSSGAQTVGSHSKQLHPSAGKQTQNTTVGEPLILRHDSFVRDECNKQSRTSALGNKNDKDQHSDSLRALTIDTHSGRRGRSRVDVSGVQDSSSRSRKEVGSRRDSAKIETNDNERRNSENSQAIISEGGPGHNFELSNDIGLGPDKIKRSSSKEVRTGSSRAMNSAVPTVDVNQDSTRSSRESSRKTNVDRFDRNRSSSCDRGSMSHAVAYPDASLLSSEPCTDTRFDSCTSTSAIHGDGRRSPSGHGSTNSPLTTSSVVESEWELYMRRLREEKQIGNSIRDKRIDQVPNPGPDRRTNRTARSDLDLRTKQAQRSEVGLQNRQTGKPNSITRPRHAEKPDSSMRSHQIGKHDLHAQTTQAGKNFAVKRPPTHPPPNKKQKVAGEASGVPNIATGSTLDDILSGLGSLSRSQVIGTRVIDQPSTRKHTTHRP